jgi:hypothetical protein
MGCIIHHGQAFDAATLRRAVKYEVHGPNLVGGLWPAQRLAMGHRNLLAFTPSYLKTCLCVQTVDALVIGHHTGLTQLQINHACPITTVPLCQCHDLRFQRRVSVCNRSIAIGTGTHANYP